MPFSRSAAASDCHRPEFVLRVNVVRKSVSADLLGKLQRARRTIASGTECRWVVNRSRRTFHIKAKRPASILNLANPKWLTPTSLILEVTTSHYGLWGAGRTLELVNTDGTWSIVRVTSEFEN